MSVCGLIWGVFGLIGILCYIIEEIWGTLGNFGYFGAFWVYFGFLCCVIEDFGTLVGCRVWVLGMTFLFGCLWFAFGL